MDTIRVFVVDDHPMIRHGLAAMLKAEPAFTWVGDATDGQDAVRAAPALAPDVVLMDLVMPRLDGVAAILALRPLLPKTRFVILTSLLDPAEVRRAMDAGASGYLLKNMEGDDLTAAIHRGFHGDSIIAPEMMGKLISAYKTAALKPGPTTSTVSNTGSEKAINPVEQAMASLSPRELDILRGIARGASNKEIAREHGIVETTVKIHVQHILRKLGVSSRVHAAVIASEQGLL